METKFTEKKKPKMENDKFIFTIVTGALATILMWMGYVPLHLALLNAADFDNLIIGGFFIESMGIVGWVAVLYYLFESKKKGE
jgi:hypothetical protein